MARDAVLRLNSLPGDSISWLVCDHNADARAEVRKESLWQDLGDTSEFARVIVLLPGADILLTRASIPSRRRGQVLAAVPFAVEDLLADNIDNCEFAVGPREAGGTYMVGCIAKRALDEVLRQLDAAALVPTAIIPDSLGVPFKEGRWSVLLIGDCALVRTGIHEGFATEVRDLAQYLEVNLDNAASQRPAAIDLYVGSEDECSPVRTDIERVGVEVEIHPHASGDAFLWFESCLQNMPGVDFLDGRKLSGSKFVVSRRRWILLAALALAWITMEAGIRYFDLRELRQIDTDLSQAIEAVYRKTFPDSRRLVDVRQQTEQYLKELSGVAAGDGDFLYLLSSISRVLSVESGIRLLSVDYRQGRLDVDLNLREMEQLNTVERALNEQTEVKTEILSATNEEDGLTAVLRVTKEQ